MLIKGKYLALYCILFQFVNNSFSQSAYDYTVNLSNGVCDGLIIDIHQIISDRTPSLNDIKFGTNLSGIPSKCLSNVNDKLQNQINDFKKSDYNNIQPIINKYCSYMKGWVEYDPGTCEAGGPPPICPKDHWYSNPSAAFDEFYKQKNKIFNERLKELNDTKKQLMDQICSCWEQELKSNDVKYFSSQQTDYMSDKDENYQTTQIKIPCLNGECPDKKYCENGFCISKTIKETGKDILKTKSKEEPISQVIKYTGKKLNEMGYLKFFYKGIVKKVAMDNVITGVFDPEMLGTYSKNYQNELIRAQENANKLEQLYDEQDRFVKNKNLTTSNLNVRKTQIAKYRSDLAKNIINLENAISNMETEGELGKCSCYNILKYNNSRLSSSLHEIINKEIKW